MTTYAVILRCFQRIEDQFIVIRRVVVVQCFIHNRVGRIMSPYTFQVVGWYEKSVATNTLKNQHVTTVYIELQVSSTLSTGFCV